MAYRILIIDDEKPARDVLATYLAKHGFAVSAVEGVEAALDLLETSPFDLVFLDLCLPEGDGFQFIGQILSRRDLPLVILTGVDFDQDLIDAARAMGASGCWSKLMLFPDLLAHIYSLMTAQLVRQTVLPPRAPSA